MEHCLDRFEHGGLVERKGTALADALRDRVELLYDSRTVEP